MPFSLAPSRSVRGRVLNRRKCSTSMLVCRHDDSSEPVDGPREKLKNLLANLKNVTSDKLRILSTLTTARTGSRESQPTTMEPRMENQQQAEQTTTEFQKPFGNRWAIAAPTTDFSGSWKPIASQEFKNKYDEYLVNCSQSYFFVSASMLHCVNPMTSCQHSHSITVQLVNREK